jgi:hypothetical protein
MLRTVKLMQTPAIGSVWLSRKGVSEANRTKKGSDSNTVDEATETGDEATETEDEATETDEEETDEDTEEASPPPVTSFSTVDGCVYTESSPKYAYMGDDDDMYIPSFSDAFSDMDPDRDVDKKALPVTICMLVYRVRPTHTYPYVEFLMAPPPPAVESTDIGAVWQPRTSGWIKLTDYVPPATDTDTHAVNACTEQLLATYPGTSMGAYRFRGFLNPSSTKTLHAVFVATATDDQDQNQDQNQDHRWAILDEIMYLKRWQGTDVDPECATCLKHHTFLTEIVATERKAQSANEVPTVQRSDRPVPLPMCMYMVQYRSSSSSSSSSSSEASQAWSVVSPPIDATSEHPWFGDQWYFTPPRAVVEDAEPEPEPEPEPSPLGEAGNLAAPSGNLTAPSGQQAKLRRRYAVFPEDSDRETIDVLFRDLSELTDEDRTYLTETYQSPRSRTTGDWPCRSTFFYEHGWPIWCVRDRHAFTRM